MSAPGDNSDKELKRIANAIVDLTSQKAEIEADIKTWRKSAKDAGFDVKALNRVVRELGMDADGQQAQLLLDFETDAYRRAVGLPTEIAAEKQEEAA